MKHPIALAGLCAGIAWVAAATAQTTADDFRKLDRNADGRLSLTEASPVTELRKVFETLDRNHDGLLSADEYAVWNEAGKSPAPSPDPATAPGGSAGAQHMPKT